jgi:hypothetical protein
MEKIRVGEQQYQELKKKALAILAETLVAYGSREKICVNSADKHFEGLYSTVERVLVDEILGLAISGEKADTNIFLDIIRDEYIICSAIWFQTDVVYSHQPKNIDKGLVIAGRRHHNCFTLVKELGLDKTKAEQGFLTSRDRFVTREEAAHIAFKSGQTTSISKCLFSEDLY